MNIRKATLADTPTISAYLFLAMEDILYEFMGIRDRQKAQELLTYFVAKEGNQYSYQNCLLAEKGSQVLGCVNIYDGATLNALRAPVVEHIRKHFNEDFNPERETQPGEYYIDSFGVGPDHQGKGIGTKILQFIIEQYTVNDRRTLGLLVDQKNPAARKLYIRLGFKVVGQKILMGKMMEHLQYEPQQDLLNRSDQNENN